MDNTRLSSQPRVLWSHAHHVKLFKDLSLSHERLSHPQSGTLLGDLIPHYGQYEPVLAPPGTPLVSAFHGSLILVQVTAHVVYLVALRRVSLC